MSVREALEYEWGLKEFRSADVAFAFGALCRLAWSSLLLLAW
jgi:hypothetical protein